MELPRPDPTKTALLALGPLDRKFIDLRRLCRAAGIVLDRADSSAQAMKVFLERGGHDAILCTGPLRDGRGANEVLETLRCIDAELEVWTLEQIEVEQIEVDPGQRQR
ncbi:MAG TPA: hypothetical protein PKE00_17320 [Planctomycetota bacterium]|nr:hypothetical protein [Planctomycetota bacterium]